MVRVFSLYQIVTNLKPFVMKKLFASILFLFFISHLSFSSSLSEEFQLINDTIFEEVDVMPEFEGGMEGLMAYVKKNTKYPEEGKANKETARVFIEFVVDKSGYVKDVKSLKKQKKYFEEEAIRVISTMPRWRAGLYQKKPVSTRVVLPITFQL